MLLTLCCPRCQKKLLVPSKKVGQALNCPSCDGLFTAKVVATAAVPRRRKEVAAKERPRHAPGGESSPTGRQPDVPFVTSRAKAASRPTGRRNDPSVRITPRRKSSARLWGIVATAAFVVVTVFLSARRHERALRPAASATENGIAVAPIDRTAATNVKPDNHETDVLPTSGEEKTFANWSTYHSAQGGFSVYLPDRREEKQHVASESLGVDGQGVQSQFVQLPNTRDPIESWPAIGEVRLRAMWVDGLAADARDTGRPSRAPFVPAGTPTTAVQVGDLPGKEFVLKNGNETEKVRLFAVGDRTVILTATFVGGESGDDASVPFGEQADRFLASLRLDPLPVGKVSALVAGGGEDISGVSDRFEAVERYARELAGSEVSEDLIQVRVSDLKAAARKARASPQEVLALLKSAKAEVEATGAGPDLAIRAVTGMLGSRAKNNR
jgi:hypothetical protein